ncbi:MAG: DmsC/YnfH family molybdoenzyme membrane anchor subunit [Betaproteobacteria bacterium]
MTYPDKGYGPSGPAPWQQTSWDWRAAGNFIGGGVGSGLVVFAAVSGAHGAALAVPMLLGLALVGLGLFCVSLELGRPLRALRVLRNPRTSWMAREAWTSALLFPVGLAAAAGVPACAEIAGALALVFVYCQARLLQAAKGIPAWREPLLVPLAVVTGLAEGAGLFIVVALLYGGATPLLLIAFGALLIARVLLWLAYRRRLAGKTAAGASAALDRAGVVLQVAGTAVPLVLAAIAGFVAGGAVLPLVVAAGLLAAFAGAYVKFTLITRAGFNQGFALAHAPVRGRALQTKGT